MALRLSECITHGWIDNREKGIVKGEIWFVEQEHPVALNLEGNCLRDIAGCHITFVNSKPGKEKRMDSLIRSQKGWTGDMTASRKVRLDVPKTYKGVPLNLPKGPWVEPKPGEPIPMANCLYLEWYSERNGRVVIEAVGFDVTIEDGPTWLMTREEEQEQQKANMAGFQRFMKQLEEAIEHQAFTQEDFTPSDEYVWEQHLRDSDRRSDRFGELFEKFEKHPDLDKIIAREMGWDHMDDLLDADENGLIEQPNYIEPFDVDDWEEDAPNPLTEGKDWIRTKRGRLAHPLQNRVFEFSMMLHHRYKDRGLLGKEENDDDLQDMIFQVQALGAKLAGALNGLAQDRMVEPGFIVALLKRTMPFINDGLADADKVQSKNLIPTEELDEYRNELLAVREEIINLMQYYRQI